MLIYKYTYCVYKKKLCKEYEDMGFFSQKKKQNQKQEQEHFYVFALHKIK